MREIENYTDIKEAIDDFFLNINISNGTGIIET